MMSHGKSAASPLTRVREALRVALLSLALAAAGQGAALAQEAAMDPQQERLVQSLSNLDAPKLGALFEHVGIQPSAEFFNCMCPPNYHYWTVDGGPCRYMGPLGGVVFTGFDSSELASCSAAFPLQDGRTVLGTITAAAAPPDSATCPAPTAEPSVEDMRLAAPFAYADWPVPYWDVRPEDILYELTADERRALKEVADQIAAFGRKVEEQAFSGIDWVTAGVTDVAKVAARSGYNVINSPKVDLRLDMELAEIAWVLNPRTGRLEVSEYLLKFPVFGKGKNLEVAVGLDGSTWDGKMKLGFSVEQDVPVVGQIEGKFGFEYDTRAVLTTSLDDDEPVAVDPGRLERAWAGLKSYLAGVDFYFGGAAGPGPDIGEHHIAVGPESTWSIKEHYSDALFYEMLAAMDAALEQQKAVEEKRHQMIRTIATQMGVENARCGTIGAVTRAIHQKVVEAAQRRGIATEGRSIRDIRKDLAAPATP